MAQDLHLKHQTPKNFQIVSGPNQSSSMSMVNGSISQSLTYSYTLRPRKLKVKNRYENTL